MDRRGSGYTRRPPALMPPKRTSSAAPLLASGTIEVRDSPHPSAKSRGLGVSLVRCSQDPEKNRTTNGHGAGLLLAFPSGEHHVFRVAVLSIVLTLAVGQNARLLCKVWCDPHEAAATSCHDQDSASPSVTGDDDCNNVVPSVAALVREDMRRSVSAPDAQHAIVVQRFQFARSLTDTRPGHEPWQDWSLEKRLLVTALRI